MKKLATPRWLGTTALVSGLANGLAFGSYAIVLWLDPREVSPVESLVPGLLGAMGVCALLQALAGLGLLARQEWGARLLPGMALGFLIVGLLGSCLAGIDVLPDYPRSVDLLFFSGAGSAWHGQSSFGWP